GILLLGELVSKLISKPLNPTAVRTLAEFFAERLADWKALRGALVGCLALLRRKADVGGISGSEAKAIAQSYIQHLQVQALGQHDRKLSLQLLECLLDCYFSAVADLGDNLVYGICGAIDGEKDPQCLLIVFSIVEILGRLYSGSSGPLVNYAEELFEVIGSYFPIHFTHPKGDEDDRKRQELSRALMMAFASTPLFEPFSIPLLLEKFSSTLPSAKLESIRYLCYCSVKYGQDRMAKHSEALWSSVKDTVYFSPDSTLSMESQSDALNFRESDIMIQAFALLREINLQNGDFINLVIQDGDMNVFLNSLNQYREFDDIPLKVKQRLHSVGRIFSACAETSAASCSKVFERFFPLLMDGLGFSAGKLLQDNHPDEACASSIKLNFGALYLCVKLLTASRYLILSTDNTPAVSNLAHHVWFSMLQIFSEPMAAAFASLIRFDNLNGAFLYLGVKGLETLAAFPESFSPVPELMYRKILAQLVIIIATEGNKKFLWKLALSALVEIGLFINCCWGSQKAVIFENEVVEKIVSLISSDNSALSVSLKLQAAFEVGKTRTNFMLLVIHTIDDAIEANLTAFHDHGNHEAIDLTVKLFDAYSQSFLPWAIGPDGSEEIPLNLALSIWEMIENGTVPLKHHTMEAGSQDLLRAITTAMKSAVGSCSTGSQNTIINKAAGVIFSSGVFDSGFKSADSVMDVEFSSRDKCLVSLLAAVVIPLHSQTSIPRGEMILLLFIRGLINGHVPSAHALGSLVNKLPSSTPGATLPGCLSLDAVLETIFHCLISSSDVSGVQSLVDIIFGLAWIGKGLVMRGHEKIRDISMIILSFLTWDHESVFLKDFRRLFDAFDEEQMHRVMISAGDAFHIVVSDSEECLNQACHAVMKPLYKQRFFSTLMPVLLSSVVKSESSRVRYMAYRAFAYVLCDAPLVAVFGEAKKLVPFIVDCLSSMLEKEASNKGIIHNVLLVLSGILTEKIGE
ncbi:hypothetical protein M569_06270, partial [Genlisea aurea]